MSNSTQLFCLQCTRSPIKCLQPLSLSLFLSWSQPYIKAHFEVSSLRKPECEGFKCQLWYVSKILLLQKNLFLCMCVWRRWDVEEEMWHYLLHVCDGRIWLSPQLMMLPSHIFSFFLCLPECVYKCLWWHVLWSSAVFVFNCVCWFLLTLMFKGVMNIHLTM